MTLAGRFFVMISVYDGPRCASLVRIVAFS
jgi:hypothetical protein